MAANLSETIGESSLLDVDTVTQTEVVCEKTCADAAHHVTNEITLISGRKQLYFRINGEKKLGSKHSASRAVLVFHGIGHNPHKYLCYAYNGLKKSGGELSDTYMISVAMASKDWMFGGRRRRRGISTKSTAYWGGTFRNWVYTMDSAVPEPGRRRRRWKVKKYEEIYGDKDSASPQFAIDEIIKVLADKSKYPNMKKIVMLGHGGGAQMLARYAVSNNVDPIDGVELVYVIANPSSYVYMTEDRPTLPSGISDVADSENLACSRHDPFDLPNRKWILKEPNMKKIDLFSKASAAWSGETTLADGFGHKVNAWPFGLDDLPEYVTEAGVTSKTMRERFIDRRVVYLSAYYDACNLHLQKRAGCGWCCMHPQEKAPQACVWDSHEVKYPLLRTRAGIAQGLTRVERAWAYWEHLKRVYGHHGKQEFYPVMGKHSSCEIFQTVSVAKKLFTEL